MKRETYWFKNEAHAEQLADYVENAFYDGAVVLTDSSEDTVSVKYDTGLAGELAQGDVYRYAQSVTGDYEIMSTEFEVSES